ncbi:TetR/AcrR family transcriptional regulator [Pseudoalteromonas luteoviolacea]|uniref:TetR/AcrR family transcriptional regulator n=1 Tax=Pseudoalteromonas luteoviolacea TaxID=43657 RepID=UPI001B3637ED|nr:TetR/AcrR family transcriptional regulator [Pseudoalteromonas luteoviolacea]MBQ4835224.1 TetR/AcrR family transcriptional regulator [Pseudoalteromonas luteoviolacea]
MTNQYSEDSVFKSKSQKGYRAKKALLDSGIELIADHGIDGFTVGELCKKANLNRTSFYSYFESIEQYIGELATRENKAFDDDFEQQTGIAYAEMTPGLKRLVLVLTQYFKRIEKDTVWNRFVVNTFSQYAPIAEVMFNDMMIDITQCIEDGDLQLAPQQAHTYCQLIFAAFGVGHQHKTPYGEVNSAQLVDMLLDAGQVKCKENVLHIYTQ